MKYLITTISIALTLSASAQTSDGKIVYERVINMHKRMPPEAEQFKAMVPEFQRSKMMLMYNDHQSLYKAIPNPEDQMPEASQPGGGDGRRFNFRMGGMDNSETFRDYNTQQMIESRELGPKMYLIEDSLQQLKWKLEGDTMTINGYLCYKASTVYNPAAAFQARRSAGGEQQGQGERRPNADSSRSGGARGGMMARMMEPQKVEAWFTDAIATSAGPDAFFGLPGLILKVVVDEGTIEYNTVSLEPLAKTETVGVPTKGKKITREEYRKMMQQQMGGMGGPGGGRTIRVIGQ